MLEEFVRTFANSYLFPGARYELAYENVEVMLDFVGSLREVVGLQVRVLDQCTTSVQ